MGLLDNLFATPESQAQFALSTGLFGVRRGNEGAALQNAMGVYNQAQEAQRRKQLADLQRQQVEMQLKMLGQQQKDNDVLRGIYSNPANFMRSPQSAFPPNEMDPGGSPAAPPAFDPNLLAQNLLRSGTLPGAQTGIQMMQKDTTPQKLGPGDVLWRPGQGVIASNPKPPTDNLPSAIKEYEYAVRQGYKGSFEQWDTARKRAGATNVGINAFEPFDVQIQKKMAENLAASQDTLKDAPTAVANIRKAKQLVAQAGSFVGSFAEKKLEVAKFLNSNLGLNIDQNGIASAEELRSRVFFQIMDNLKKLDAQPSQLQQKIMMESLGQLTTDPKALPRVLNAFEEAIIGKVKGHNERVKQFEERARKGKHGFQMPYDLSIVVPDAEDNSELSALRKKHGLN